MEFLTTTQYDSSVFIKAVNKIQTICQMPKDGKFDYLPNYKLYLSVIFCNNIFDKLDALVYEESQKKDHRIEDMELFLGLAIPVYIKFI